MTRLHILAGLLLLIALLFQLEIVGVVAITIAAAALISRFWVGYVQRRLGALRSVPEYISYGEDAIVTLEVENRSLLPILWLDLRERVPLGLRVVDPPRMVLALGAGAKQHFTYQIKGQRRGWYRIGPLQLVVGDVLGLSTRKLQTPPSSVTVHPRVVPLPLLSLPANLGLGPLVGKQGEDPARPAGVRQYVPGDDVRRLDWKSSARQATLLMRRSDPTIAPETTIAVAFGSHDYPQRILGDALERAATVAASVGVALLGYKLSLGLVTNGIDPQSGKQGIILRSGKGAGQRQALLGLLGRLEAGAEVDFWKLLHDQSLAWGGTLILVMSDLTPAILPSIEVLRRRGLHPMLLLIDATHDGLAVARERRIPSYKVDRRSTLVPVGT
jgi:uncharacterized protein (DUF58 family)